MTDDELARTITLLLCGPSKCEHDYQADCCLLDGGGTAVCDVCGRFAIDEAMWQ